MLGPRDRSGGINMGWQSARTEIIVALIGLVGIIGAAVIANVDKLSPPRLEGSPGSPPPGTVGPVGTGVHPAPREPGLLIDDANPVIRYSEGGGWTTAPDFHALKSTQHYTNNPGSTATLDFRGDWIEVAFYRERGGAIMSVDIDGKFKDPIDCGSPSGETKYQQAQQFTRLGSGSHRIVLTHTGTPPDGRPARSFGDYTVNIDGFTVARAEN